MQQASINFYNAIKDTYEPNWAGHSEILNAVEVSTVHNVIKFNDLVLHIKLLAPVTRKLLMSSSSTCTYLRACGSA